MVTIVNYKERLKDDETSFFVLELQGGIEMTQSKATGMFYATAKKAIIPSTFDEVTCKGLIGTQIPGSIEKQECEPYEYVVQETGEEIILSHRWVYLPEETNQSESKPIKADASVFSENGVYDEAFV
ncbi:hypothetical protein [Moheibacter sediminis]|uniref:Uncharacterized protein n=1 Tax=Moheibacter sediminis TaxID=1434700 RepID=A0A1W2C7K8_9FLAO|nr:hypothetical protein [Moheibacter sediminis]SMC81257.1 hypothetical protein SAMN06296427_10948 [Moheibacter sediminis]